MEQTKRIIPLTEDYQFGEFDCGNQDLNHFLLEDAKHLLSVTYLLEIDGEVAGFFSVSNDKIGIPDSDKATWRKIKKSFPHAKHRGDYPAVKIGRLAVDKRFQGQNIGTILVDFIRNMFIHGNRTGCAFVTVDALASARPFYLKNGFKYLDKSESEKSHVTYLLYYDLAQLL